MSFIQHNHNGVVYHTSSTLAHPQIVHGFSTRLGGVSEGYCSSLNLRGGGPTPDDRDKVRENYRRFCDALGTDVDRLVLSQQVHSDIVRHVTGDNTPSGIYIRHGYTADALVTNEPGHSLMVFSADCIILLFHDPVSRSIGAVHAGWRGTAKDLPAKTVAEMGRLFGAQPRNIRVAIGAGIGPCCFETHDDVPDAMRAAFGAEVEAFITPRDQKWTVDLKAVNAWRLREMGIPAEQIDICPLCTACHPELYWSHRKMGDQRGVQGCLIYLAAGEGAKP